MGFFIAVVWFILTIVAGVMANKRNRSALGYVVMSLLLSPLVAMLVLAGIGKKEKNDENLVY